MMLPVFTAAALLVQVTPYQRAPLPPWVPQAAAPVSRPSLLISPPPATWSGPWRPEYGTMILKPWEAK